MKKQLSFPTQNCEYVSEIDDLQDMSSKEILKSTNSNLSDDLSLNIHTFS